MTGNGTSLAGANIVFGNLEIAAGTSGSPITLTSNATLAASKTFTVTSSGYLSMGTNVISFNGASGTVNISGSVLETKQVG